MLKKLFVLLTICMAFCATAYADIADPYGRPRTPRLPRPVTQVYRGNPTGFDLQPFAEAENAFELLVKTPGPCEYTYTFRKIKGEELFPPQTVAVDQFGAQESRQTLELPLPAPDGRLLFTVEVRYQLFNYADTNYGPKLVDKQGDIVQRTGAYGLKYVNGNLILYALDKGMR